MKIERIEHFFLFRCMNMNEIIFSMSKQNDVYKIYVCIWKSRKFIMSFKNDNNNISETKYITTNFVKIEIDKIVMLIE